MTEKSLLYRYLGRDFSPFETVVGDGHVADQLGGRRDDIVLLATASLVSDVGNPLPAIPVASLAAVLVFTGYKLINPAVIKTLRTYGRGEVLVYATTIIAIVATVTRKKFA